MKTKGHLANFDTGDPTTIHGANYCCAATAAHNDLDW